MTAAATTPVAAGLARSDRGRTRLTSKALTRVVAAVTADALGVDARSVGVQLGDSRGILQLTVTTPIRVVSLARVESGRDAVRRAGGSILDRAAAAQETIRDRVSALTGYRIGRVTVRLSAAHIQNEERVS